MLISEQQIRQIEKVDNHIFPAYMKGHLREYFPISFQYLDEKAFLNLIKAGTENAAQYGFTSRYEVCLYIDVMMMLGTSFDTDFQLPFVKKILRPVVAINSRLKVEQLLNETYDYLEEVVGETNIFPVIQYEQLLDEPVQHLSPDSSPIQEDKMLEIFRNLWPAKYLNIGEGILKHLILMGQKTAGSLGFTNRVSVYYFLLLQFLFGHRFYEDPLYNTIGFIFKNKDIINEHERYRQFADKVRERLAAFVVYTTE